MYWSNSSCWRKACRRSARRRTIWVVAAYLAALGAAAAKAENLAYYGFEEYRNNEDPDVVLIPSNGLKPRAAVTGTFPSGPYGPNPDQDFINNAYSNSARLFGFHADTIGAFSSDVPFANVPVDGRPNLFSWDISQDIPVAGAEQGVRDLYDVPQAGENLLRPGMSGAANYTVELSFKQSIQRGYQALVSRDYVFLDTITNPAPSGSARQTSPLGSFWLGIAANDGPGEDSQARIHFYTFNSAGEIAITDPGQTGNSFNGLGPVIEPDVWYDLAVVGDGTNANFYLQSPSDSQYQLIGTLPQNGLRSAHSTAGWAIGRGQFDGTNDGVANGTPADGFRGWIDEVRISNSAIPVDQLLASPAVPVVPGDYNKNGLVDAADYTVWRDQLGLTVDLPNRDPVLVGTPIGADDYTFWKNHFGEAAGVGAAAAVPEPAVGVLVLLGLAAWGRGFQMAIVRRRRQ